MNPDTNTFEALRLVMRVDLDNAVARTVSEVSKPLQLVRPDGTPVPEHWSKYSVDEIVDVKGYLFKVAHIGESHLLLEPHGPILVGGGVEEDGP